MSCNRHDQDLPPEFPAFQPGDKVTAFGNAGTVKRISPNGMYVEVNFPEFDSIVTFHLDGKYSQWHKEPSLRKSNV